jgi:hypothetical protein
VYHYLRTCHQHDVVLALRRSITFYRQSGIDGSKRSGGFDKIIFFRGLRTLTDYTKY